MLSGDAKRGKSEVLYVDELHARRGKVDLRTAPRFYHVSRRSATLEFVGADVVLHLRVLHQHKIPQALALVAAFEPREPFQEVIHASRGHVLLM